MFSGPRESKVSLAQYFNVNNDQDNLRECIANSVDAKADVSEKTTNFYVIADKKLMFVFPRCIDKARHSLIGNIFSLSVHILDMISNAKQNDLVDLSTFSADGQGYKKLPCIQFETTSPEKILETIKNYYIKPSMKM